MTSCESVQRCLSAWVDGETVPLASEAMRAHLDTCAACRAEEARLREFRGALRSAFVVQAAPLRLEGGIRARAFVGRNRVALGAFAALAAVLVGVGAVSAGDHAYEDEAVAAHEAIVSSRLPLDFAETDPARLSALLRHKLGLEVELPAMAQSSLRLLGARLVQLQGRDSAVLLFDDGGKGVTLAVRARRGPAVRAAPVFKNRRVGGYEVISWDHGALTYSLVSGTVATARGGCAACHVVTP